MGDVIKLRQYGSGGWKETRGKIYKAIMSGTDFESGAMTASHEVSVGRLDEEWRDVLFTDSPDYIVYSYATPIAWHVPDDGDDGGERWVIPDVRYSSTTTRHQNIVRTALVFNSTNPLETLSEAKTGRSRAE